MTTEYNMSEDLGVIDGDLILCELTECQAEQLKEVINRVTAESEQSKINSARLDERIIQARTECQRVEGGNNAPINIDRGRKRPAGGAVQKRLRVETAKT